MPGKYVTPRAYNRRWWIDLSVNDTPEWAEIAKGISSRGNSINEQSQDYYDMAGRGVAESEVTGVTVSRTWSGWRVDGRQRHSTLQCVPHAVRGCDIRDVPGWRVFHPISRME